VSKKLPENTFAHINEDGFMEIIDIFTGQVIAVQKEQREILIDNLSRAKKHTRSDGSEFWLEAALENEQLKVNNYEYSDVLADVICQLIAEKGISLRAIAGRMGVPPLKILRRWRVQFPEFERKLQLANKDRAEFFLEQALNSAEAANDLKDAPAEKLRVDTYKWAAQVLDNDTFGAKTKISGDANAPLQIIIDTGIRRAPVESKQDDAIDVSPTKEQEVIGGEF
jgi:transposase-like protein